MGEIFDALRRAELCDEDLKPAPEDSPSPQQNLDAAPPPGAMLRPDDAIESEEIHHESPHVELATELMADWVSRAVITAPTSNAASRFRHAALRVRHALAEAGGSLFAVSSANAGEGKTTSSCNLALAMASMTSGGSVALVDADLRNPRLASALGVEFEVGFEQVLSGEVSLREARIRTQFEALDLYPSHCWGRDAHELLADSRTAEVLQDIGSRYDAVLIDCPPVLPVPDTRLIAEHVHACMLVVRAGSTRTRALEEALHYLEHARIAGVFVNCLEQRGASSYYHAYGEQEAS
jgi:receptor protein-tyrosine kinase/non-specific protein-tyrosine kinase